jgi:hypothetical protein
MLESFQNLYLPHNRVNILVEILQGDSFHRNELAIVEIKGSINNTELPFAYAIAKLLK